MRNPVLARSDVFMGGNQYQQANHTQTPYAMGVQQVPQYARMTVADVLTKSVLSLAIVAAIAGATFVMLPMNLLYPVWIGAALTTFVLALVVGRQAKVSPVGVVIYSAVEGVFLGGVTKFFELLYPGVAMQAVLATFVAAGVVLFSYQYLHVRLSAKFMRTVAMITMAYAVVLLINLLLSLVGVQLGLTPASFTWLGMIIALVGATLAVLSLMSDIQQIDEAIQSGAPESESWRAAFALTVTMVWLYTELLRILSYLRSN